MIRATVGQLMINKLLPEELRDYTREFDKKSLNEVLQKVALQYPDRYRDVSFGLVQLGGKFSQEQGGFSFGPEHMRKSKAGQKIAEQLQAKIQSVLDDDSLTPQQRRDRVVLLTGRESERQQNEVMREALSENNPLALQVLSGTRGKPMNLASLLGSDMLYTDHRDRVIPIPVLRSYSQGLSPEEYWAGTYGARRGIIATKFATQKAGYFSKQLNAAAHRLVVSGEDSDEPFDPSTPRGYAVATADKDNEGALLAVDTGPYKRNTVLTPKILKHIERLGNKKILIRSPIVGGAEDGGIYARDIGVVEGGKFPGRGEIRGLAASAALSEPVSQGQLSAKHSGGVAGQEKSVGGFELLNQLVQMPKKMKGGATHASVDGKVDSIQEAPAGGHYVVINDSRHYVPPSVELRVKVGDEIEAGDAISSGIPNPASVIRHKGLGEGRRYFVDEYRKAMQESGMGSNRRNIELLARALINHVRLTEEIGDYVQDDILPYNAVEKAWKVRSGYTETDPEQAIGKYLEKPILHYSIGTKIRPSIARQLQEFGVSKLTVHDKPPPFEPEPVRAMYQMQNDPDWMTQMYGSGLKKSLLTSVARGSTSDRSGTSFVPSLAYGMGFGRNPDYAVSGPEPRTEPPPQPEPSDFESDPKAASLLDGLSPFLLQKYANDALPQPPRTPATPPLTSPQASPPNLSSSPAPVQNSTAGSGVSSAPTQTSSRSVPLSTNTQFLYDRNTFYNADIGDYGKFRQTTPQQTGTYGPVGDTVVSMAKNVGNFFLNNRTWNEVANGTSAFFSPWLNRNVARVTPTMPNSAVTRGLNAMNPANLAGKAQDLGARAARSLATSGAGRAVSRAGAAMPTLSRAIPALATGGKALSYVARGAGPAAYAIDAAQVGFDIANKGWDQTTNDNAKALRDAFAGPGFDLNTFGTDSALARAGNQAVNTLADTGNAALHVLNPVRNTQIALGTATQAAGTAYEGGAAAADAARRNLGLGYDLKDQEVSSWNLADPQFKENVRSTIQDLRSQLPAISDVAQREAIQRQIAEYDNLTKRWDNEVGYFGAGEFGKSIDALFRGKKQRYEQISRELAAAADDPNRQLRLEADRQRLLQDLKNFRTWAQ